MDLKFESKKAVRKIFNHALKFPNDNLLGIIVGKIDNGNPNDVKVYDAFPLFHTTPTLPTLELAF